MNLRQFFRNTKGTTAVEFGITAPALVMLIIGTVQGGLMLWTQLGLQQGVEMGARCGSVDNVLCGSTSAIQNYAAQHSYGVNASASTFEVATLSCGTQVSASYAFPVISSYFSVGTLKAQSCFPR